jgi:hypothetical protein
MKGLDKGGQGTTSGCCAIEEEEEDDVLCRNNCKSCLFEISRIIIKVDTWPLKLYVRDRGNM